MSAQTQALKQAVASLTSTADTAVAQASTLKSKLDAAISDNVAKAAQIAQLQAQLAGAGTPPDTSADTQDVVDATNAVAAVTQKLADSNAVNSPSN